MPNVYLNLKNWMEMIVRVLRVGLLKRGTWNSFHEQVPKFFHLPSEKCEGFHKIYLHKYFRSLSLSRFENKNKNT